MVERHLEGRDGDLKESVIGVEVIGREPGFDAEQQDCTVRSEAESPARSAGRILPQGEGSGDSSDY